MTAWPKYGKILPVAADVQCATVAQLVEQLTRNEQVACSNQVSSSKAKPPKVGLRSRFSGVFVCAAGEGEVGGCALITPVYLEIALFSGARSGTQATGQIIGVIGIADISIRALREEGDPGRAACIGKCRTFLSTPSARRATFFPHISEKRASISIHALREEGDLSLPLRAWFLENFYPRPPRGGRPTAANSSHSL